MCFSLGSRPEPPLLSIQFLPTYSLTSQAQTRKCKKQKLKLANQSQKLNIKNLILKEPKSKIVIKWTVSKPLQEIRKVPFNNLIIKW